MPTRDTVLQEARRWIGTPYAHQASLIGVGADCLGLLLGIYGAVFGTVPEAVPPYGPAWADAREGDRLAAAAARHLDPIESRVWDAADVLLFRWRPDLPARHMALATGPDTMIHAYDGAAVCETAIGPWWVRHLAGVYGFRGLTP